MERSKTLSNKAHKFDQQRLVGTKPEIAYRLKFVKTDDTETKDEESGAGGPDQENGEYSVTSSRILNILLAKSNKTVVSVKCVVL